MKKYPDISLLLKKKANRRQRLARLSFEEKIDIVNKWRELSRHIRRLRLGSFGTQSENNQDGADNGKESKERNQNEVCQRGSSTFTTSM